MIVPVMAATAGKAKVLHTPASAQFRMTTVREVRRVRIIAWRFEIDPLAAIYAVKPIPLKDLQAPPANVLKSGKVDAAMLRALMDPSAHIGVAREEARGRCSLFVEFVGPTMQEIVSKSY